MNIIGVDGCGLGSIVGPVVAAAVVFPEGLVLSGVADSKRLTAARRMNTIAVIHKHSLHWSLAQSSAAQIDRYGIQRCDESCMVVCVQRCLSRFPDACVIVDGNRRLPLSIPASQQTALPKADATVQAVSAASIFAKVWRDDWMIWLSSLYPLYEWDKNKGYPVPRHLKQLELHGVSPEHRRSYGPVKRALKGK